MTQAGQTNSESARPPLGALASSPKHDAARPFGQKAGRDADDRAGGPDEIGSADRNNIPLGVASRTFTPAGRMLNPPPQALGNLDAGRLCRSWPFTPVPFGPRASTD